MATVRFEWDSRKDRENQSKHGVAFAVAQFAFVDPRRVIAEDLAHGAREERYFCFGRVEGNVLTVRFTFRGNVIRIFGAGYWRRGKTIHERENQIHE
ncbi:MAG: BrnT family toxin [Candidatus Rokuibacteriota bacterium]